MTTVKSQKDLKRMFYILRIAEDTINSREDIDKEDSETLLLIDHIKDSMKNNMLIQIGKP